MTEALTPAEIDDQIDLRKARLDSVIADIRAILVDDIPGFFKRQAKSAFLSNPEKAHLLSRDEVGSLKANIADSGAAAAKTLNDRLGDANKWMASPSDVNDARTLVDCTEVWMEVRSIEATLQAVLEGAGLDASPPVYKAPLYFVNGRYFPALAEHFWRLLAEIHRLKEERGEAESDRVRDSLTSKWDDA